MADIRIKDLPLATGGTAPTGADAVAIDGLTTRKTTISALGDVAVPVASQAEAEAGDNSSKRMTPLTTKQSIASEVGDTIASAAQGALAESALQPGGAATPAQGALADTALQPAYNYISRAGNYLGVGQQADFDGFGKGGILLGGGDPSRGTGTYLTLDGLRNWVVVQSAKADNPTELIVYGSSAQGYAQCVVGGGNITRLYGSSFRADMVGNTFYFLRKKFRVGAFSSSNSITLTELDSSPVNFPTTEIEAFNYSYTTGDGFCNIVGDMVYWVSGDPFVPSFFRDFKVVINGVTRTILNFISPKQWQLTTSPGNAANVAFSWRGDINDQLTTLRIQAIQGENEENVNLYSIAGDNFYGRYYALTAGVAGAYARSRPINIGSGSFGAYLNRYQLSIVPEDAGAGHNGYAELGGANGLGALRVYCPSTMALNRNYLAVYPVSSGSPPGMQAQGVDTNIDAFIAGKGDGGVRLGNQLANYVKAAGAPMGFAPAIRAQGSDANVGMGIDAKGTGNIVLTQDFARTVALFTAPSLGVNFPEFDASVTNNPVVFAARGNDANVDLLLSPKGSGVVRVGTWTSNTDTAVNGYITIKDAAGNARKLATIA